MIWYWIFCLFLYSIPLAFAVVVYPIAMVVGVVLVFAALFCQLFIKTTPAWVTKISQWEQRNDT